MVEVTCPGAETAKPGERVVAVTSPGAATAEQERVEAVTSPGAATAAQEKGGEGGGGICRA